jgi:hypothetical protein
MQLLSLLPSPVQMVYPFFVGTAGADYLPLAFNDKIAAPPEFKSFFSEKLVYIPNSYYVNSHLQAFGAQPPRSLQLDESGEKAWEGDRREGESRGDAERYFDAVIEARKDEFLPPDGPVICNFNQIYKVDGETYATWMDVLEKEPAASLWLRTEGESTHDVLLQNAKRLRVNARRIVFAKWAPTSASHVRRIALASLSLDTPLYNSMTTACDALWAGVPLVSSPGEKMVSRLGASILLALNVPWFVARDAAEYAALGALIVRAAAMQFNAAKLRAEAAVAEIAALVAATKVEGKRKRKNKPVDVVAAVAGSREAKEVRPGAEAEVLTPQQLLLAHLKDAFHRARLESSLFNMEAKADQIVTGLRLAWEIYSSPKHSRGHRGRASKGYRTRIYNTNIVNYNYTRDF